MTNEQQLLLAVLAAAKCTYDDKNYICPKPNYDDKEQYPPQTPIVPPNQKTY